MIAAEQTFDGTWPYPARFTEAAGFRQHYVDEGPERPDHTIVMLHGEPTWGYEWRHLIGPLSRHHRVLVPDHMGFGKSETPEDRTYDASEHISNRCSSTRSISRISTLVVRVLSDQLETLLGRPPRTLRWALQNNTNLRQLTSAPSH
jgi:pimeloyl-ACP methyl ester carboxylesterase